MRNNSNWQKKKVKNMKDTSEYSLCVRRSIFLSSFLYLLKSLMSTFIKTQIYSCVFVFVFVYINCRNENIEQTEWIRRTHIPYTFIRMCIRNMLACFAYTNTPIFSALQENLNGISNYTTQIPLFTTYSNKKNGIQNSSSNEDDDDDDDNTLQHETIK